MTKLLKMSTFSVVMFEKTWEQRFPTKLVVPDKRKQSIKLIVSPATITPVTLLKKLNQKTSLLNAKIHAQKSDTQERISVSGERPKKTTECKENTLQEIKTQNEKTHTTSIEPPNPSDETVKKLAGPRLDGEEIVHIKHKIFSLKGTRKNWDAPSNKRRKISLLQSNFRNNVNQTNSNKFEEKEMKKIVSNDIKKEGQNKSLLLDKNTRNTLHSGKLAAATGLKQMSSEVNRTQKINNVAVLENTTKSNLSEEVLVEICNTDSNEGLGNLLSVAEAFEKSQKPDFNDVLSPILNGTDTEKILVRSCVICEKKLLGRNAYGRHMKNVHSKIFGPYPCPDCSKQFESGYLLMQHMYIHLGPRGKAAGKKYFQRYLNMQATKCAKK